jgi:spore coat protein U-like protein
VDFQLQALPAEPARQMRDSVGGFYLGYEMFVDAARTRWWGDGTQGSSTLGGTLLLDDRNRVGTLAFPIYGTVRGGQQLVPPGQWLGAVITRVEYLPACTGGL